MHTKWDSVQVGEVLGDRGDVAYISMLRDPVELFRSMWDYLPQKAGGAKSLEEFAMALAANNLKVSVSQLDRHLCIRIMTYGAILKSN